MFVGTHARFSLLIVAPRDDACLQSFIQPGGIADEIPNPPWVTSLTMLQPVVSSPPGSDMRDSGEHREWKVDHNAAPVSVLRR